MARTRRIISGLAVSGLALGATFALAGCSSETPDPAKTSASGATSSSAAAEPIGGDTLPPVVITSKDKTATAKVGESLYFDVADVTAWSITSDNPAVVAVTPGTDDGTMQTVPGGEALSEGVATVTLENTKGLEAWVVTVTVTP
jgi:hypothetical protein